MKAFPYPDFHISLWLVGIGKLYAKLDCFLKPGGKYANDALVLSDGSARKFLAACSTAIMSATFTLALEKSLLNNVGFPIKVNEGYVFFMYL